jgi:hypothetical protein
MTVATLMQNTIEAADAADRPGHELYTYAR